LQENVEALPRLRLEVVADALLIDVLLNILDDREDLFDLLLADGGI
jgi:hypothetical protein